MHCSFCLVNYRQLGLLQNVVVSISTINDSDDIMHCIPVSLLHITDIHHSYPFHHLSLLHSFIPSLKLAYSTNSFHQKLPLFNRLPSQTLRLFPKLFLSYYCLSLILNLF